MDLAALQDTIKALSDDDDNAGASKIGLQDEDAECSLDCSKSSVTTMQMGFALMVSKSPPAWFQKLVQAGILSR